MQNALKVEIKHLAKRTFIKEASAHKLEESYRAKFYKRTGEHDANPPPARNPNTSTKKNNQHLHFDPKYCSKNANLLAEVIWRKVLANKYKPVPAICYHIPKPDGSKRQIMAFTIPDTALANITLRRARDRNIKRLSPSSYAYHPDKNIFDAIMALKEFDHKGKLFAVQIDFEKYFDNILSHYLKSKINDSKKISLTPHEKHIFESFMHHSYALNKSTAAKLETRHKGTPQGSSVSLFLANMANHDLDVQLTANAGKFARFADDIVAFCSEYSHAQLIEQCFLNHCRTSGLKMNIKKSPGIAIIASETQELRTYPYLDFLGYRFTADGLSTPDATVKRIKSRISRLTNIYLVQYIKQSFNKDRCSNTPSKSYDWDLLGLLCELRRSLYGDLSEQELLSFINDGTKLRHMRGLMGFYCLLDDAKQLKEIDGWMLSIVRRATRVRNKILQNQHSTSCPTPSNTQLVTGSWLDLSVWSGAEKPETKIPSLVLGWRAARKHFLTYGLEEVEAPNYGLYSKNNDIFNY